MAVRFRATGEVVPSCRDNAREPVSCLHYTSPVPATAPSHQSRARRALRSRPQLRRGGAVTAREACRVVEHCDGDCSDDYGDAQHERHHGGIGPIASAAWRGRAEFYRRESSATRIIDCPSKVGAPKVDCSPFLWTPTAPLVAALASTRTAVVDPLITSAWIPITRRRRAHDDIIVRRQMRVAQVFVLVHIYTLTPAH
jgi:hypothetical protein